MENIIKIFKFIALCIVAYYNYCYTKKSKRKNCFTERIAFILTFITIFKFCVM